MIKSNFLINNKGILLPTITKVKGGEITSLEGCKPGFYVASCHNIDDWADVDFSRKIKKDGK